VISFAKSIYIFNKCTRSPMVKVKLFLGLITEAPLREDEWRSGGIAPPFLTSALDEGKWSTSRSGRFIRGETAPGTHCIRSMTRPRVGLDVMDKRNTSRLCPKSNPNFSVVQSLYWLSYPGNTKKKTTKLRGRSPQANYTDRPPLVGEVSANLCG
jgi:hypothetical protein